MLLLLDLAQLQVAVAGGMENHGGGRKKNLAWALIWSFCSESQKIIVTKGGAGGAGRASWT
jgi:hypothetical protein